MRQTPEWSKEIYTDCDKSKYSELNKNKNAKKDKLREALVASAN